MPAAAVAFVAVASSIYTGIRLSQEASYNRKVANANAKYAENKAAFDEKIHRERVRKLLATQRALYGGSGISSEEGTPLLVMEDTVAQGELDALAIRYGGDIESARMKMAGKLAKMEGQSRAMSSYTQAGSSLIQGGVSAYQWAKTSR